MEAFQRSALSFAVYGFLAFISLISAVETRHPMAIACTIILAIPCILSGLALVAKMAEERQ